MARCVQRAWRLGADTGVIASQAIGVDYADCRRPCVIERVLHCCNFWEEWLIRFMTPASCFGCFFGCLWIVFVLKIRIVVLNGVDVVKKLSMLAACALACSINANAGDLFSVHGDVFSGVEAEYFSNKSDGKVKEKALVSGNLLLRGAKYRYSENLASPDFPATFVGAGCDIFQLVLTVNRGSVALVTIESPSSREDDLRRGMALYKDTLTPQSGMFSYTLYSNNVLKGFGLVSTAGSAEVTAFGYCFSTNIAAAMDFSNAKNN